MTNSESNEANMSDEQVLNFSWWLCMLPFFAAIGFCIWRWFQDKTDGVWLLYSLAALILGLIFTALVAGASSESDGAGTTAANTSSSGTADDTNK